MNDHQHAVINRIRGMGYAVDMLGFAQFGAVRVALRRKLREGTFSLIVARDGTYRDSRYLRWDYRQREAA